MGWKGALLKPAEMVFFAKQKQKQKTDVGREGHQILDLGIFPPFFFERYTTQNKVECNHLTNVFVCTKKYKTNQKNIRS